MEENTDEITKTKCELKFIQTGLLLRIVITFLTFIIVKKKNYENKKLLIIIPVLLEILDNIDCEFARLRFYLRFKKNKRCTTLFYEKLDKIVDLLSYIIVWYLFGLDDIFFIFCIWRAIGVVLFVSKGKNYFLMVAPDLMKEYLVYRYFFPSENKWLIAVILLKIMFEIRWHSKNYSTNPVETLNKK